jgi:hypothetical protein
MVSGRNRVGVEDDGLRAVPGETGFRGMKKGVLGAAATLGEGMALGHKRGGNLKYRKVAEV